MRITVNLNRLFRNGIPLLMLLVGTSMVYAPSEYKAKSSQHIKGDSFWASLFGFALPTSKNAIELAGTILINISLVLLVIFEVWDITHPNRNLSPAENLMLNTTSFLGLVLVILSGYVRDWQRANNVVDGPGLILFTLGSILLI